MLQNYQIAQNDFQKSPSLVFRKCGQPTNSRENKKRYHNLIISEISRVQTNCKRNHKKLFELKFGPSKSSNILRIEQRKPFEQLENPAKKLSHKENYGKKQYQHRSLPSNFTHTIFRITKKCCSYNQAVTEQVKGQDTNQLGIRKWAQGRR